MCKFVPQTGDVGHDDFGDVIENFLDTLELGYHASVYSDLRIIPSENCRYPPSFNEGDNLPVFIQYPTTGSACHFLCHKKDLLKSLPCICSLSCNTRLQGITIHIDQLSIHMPHRTDDYQIFLRRNDDTLRKSNQSPVISLLRILWPCALDMFRWNEVCIGHMLSNPCHRLLICRFNCTIE